jgi:hypothetical protein
MNSTVIWDYHIIIVQLAFLVLAVSLLAALGITTISTKNLQHGPVVASLIKGLTVVEHLKNKHFCQQRLVPGTPNNRKNGQWPNNHLPSRLLCIAYRIQNKKKCSYQPTFILCHQPIEDR